MLLEDDSEDLEIELEYSEDTIIEQLSDSEDQVPDLNIEPRSMWQIWFENAAKEGALLPPLKRRRKIIENKYNK